VPTIRQVEEALAKRPHEPAPRRRPAPWRLTNEALRWRVEKDQAPLEARNALLPLLDEARRTRWIAIASLAVSVATLLVVLFRG
jgi:hypothetical protein